MVAKSLGRSGLLGGGGALTEAVLEAAVDRLEVGHAAGTTRDISMVVLFDVPHRA